MKHLSSRRLPPGLGEHELGAGGGGGGSEGGALRSGLISSTSQMEM